MSEWGTPGAEDAYREAILSDGYDSTELLTEINLIAGDKRATVEMVATAIKNIGHRAALIYLREREEEDRKTPRYPPTPMVGWPPLEMLAGWLHDRTGKRFHDPGRTPHLVLMVDRGKGSVYCRHCDAIKSFWLDEPPTLPERSAPEYPAAVLALLEEYEAKHRECKAPLRQG